MDWLLGLGDIMWGFFRVPGRELMKLWSGCLKEGYLLLWRNVIDLGRAVFRVLKNTVKLFYNVVRLA
jgi:hypothetical protein